MIFHLPAMIKNYGNVKRFSTSGKNLKTQLRLWCNFGEVTSITRQTTCKKINYCSFGFIIIHSILHMWRSREIPSVSARLGIKIMQRRNTVFQFSRLKKNINKKNSFIFYFSSFAFSSLTF